IAFYRRRARRLLPLFALGCFVGYLVNHTTLRSLLLALTTLSMFSTDEFFPRVNGPILDPYVGNMVQYLVAGPDHCGCALRLLACLCCSRCYRPHTPTRRNATLICRSPHQPTQGLRPCQD